MPAAIGATAIAWITRALSGRLAADRGDRSGDYMRISLYDIKILTSVIFRSKRWYFISEKVQVTVP